MSKLIISQRLKRAKLLEAGFWPEEIAFYGLMSKSEKEISEYVASDFMQGVIRPVLNTEMVEIINDKWVSQLFLEAIGVRMPKLFGLWHSDVGMAPGGSALRSAEHFSDILKAKIPQGGELDLFFKPQAGGQGKNAFRVSMLRREDEIYTTRSDGMTQTLPAFLASLPTNTTTLFQLGGQGWIVQECVSQHPDVAVLNPSSLNTARVVTYWKHPVDGEKTVPEIELAYLKIGRAGHDTDLGVGQIEKDPNAGPSGAVQAAINLETGRLEYGSYGWRAGGKSLDNHPDTGCAITGRKMPYWNEVKELCYKAAHSFPGMRAIGWDVAFSQDGPVIIEGNDRWAIVSPQGYQPYLNTTRRARFKREGVPIPPEKLPSAAVAVIRRLKHRIKYYAWKIRNNR